MQREVALRQQLIHLCPALDEQQRRRAFLRLFKRDVERRVRLRARAGPVKFPARFDGRAAVEQELRDVRVIGLRGEKERRCLARIARLGLRFRARLEQKLRDLQPTLLRRAVDRIQPGILRQIRVRALLQKQLHHLRPALDD